MEAKKIDGGLLPGRTKRVLGIVPTCSSSSGRVSEAFALPKGRGDAMRRPSWTTKARATACSTTLAGRRRVRCSSGRPVCAPRVKHPSIDICTSVPVSENRKGVEGTNSRSASKKERACARVHCPAHLTSKTYGQTLPLIDCYLYM